MLVYTEYQVKELLRRQRECCAQVVESKNGMKHSAGEILSERVRQAAEPAMTPCLKAYTTQDLKSSLMAGFGAGFDSGNRHWREEEVLEKFACINYMTDFNEWFMAYNQRKAGVGFLFQNEKTLSK